MPPRKRVGDLTGLESERLIKENAAELKRRSAEISMMAEIEEEEDKLPIDYSDGPITRAVPEDDITVTEFELEVPTRTIIPAVTIEQMTFGAGKHYDFEAGKKYVVKADLANHLKAKGLLWEGGYR
jgi:hypothetical protein